MLADVIMIFWFVVVINVFIRSINQVWPELKDEVEKTVACVVWFISLGLLVISLAYMRMC